MTGENEKKGSHQQQVSWSCLGSLIVVLGVIIIGFNYWHAMKCVESNGLEDTHEYIEAMEKRVIQVENRVKLVKDQTNRLIRQLQEKVIHLDEKKLQSILELSKDLAIRTALSLETQPAPPQTQYLVDDKNKMEQGNQWDDLFNEFGEGAKTHYDDPWEESGNMQFQDTGAENFEEFHDDDIKADDFEKTQAKLREENIENYRKEQNVDPAKQLEECKGWKEDYGVLVGVSWGDLPYDLQLRWKASNCDYYISKL